MFKSLHSVLCYGSPIKLIKREKEEGQLGEGRYSTSSKVISSPSFQSDHYPISRNLDLQEGI